MRNYILIGLAVLFGAAAIFFYMKQRTLQKEADSAAVKVQIYNEQLGRMKAHSAAKMDSLAVLYKVADSMATYYRKSYETVKANEKLIVKKYNQLQNEIATTSDSNQHAITQRLLAELKRY